MEPRAMTNQASILDCLAAAYRLDLDDEAYVQNLVDEAAPLLDRGLGVLAYTYDARDPARPKVERSATSTRFEAKWLEQFYTAVDSDGVSGYYEPTGFHAWGHMTCGQASAVAGMRPFLPYFAIVGGARDAFAMNARDASDRGLWLGAPLPTTRKVSAEQLRLFTRFSAHLAAAMRLRRGARGVGRGADAVLSPEGSLLHAEPAAKPLHARADLRRAALAFDQARTRKMRGDAETATRRWRPLVASRWSLLDEFDSDGKRFVVAVENTPPTRAPRRELSAREHHVMTQAHLGHTDKVIAYELGLSHSTVRVLMHRAMRKLGVTTRREALALFDARVQESAPE